MRARAVILASLIGVGLLALFGGRSSAAGDGQLSPVMGGAGFQGLGDGGAMDPTALHSRDGGTSNIGGQLTARNITVNGAAGLTLDTGGAANMVETETGITRQTAQLTVTGSPVAIDGGLVVSGAATFKAAETLDTAGAANLIMDETGFNRQTAQMTISASPLAIDGGMTVSGATTVKGNLVAGQLATGDGGVTALGGVLSAISLSQNGSGVCSLSGGANCAFGNSQIRFLPTAGAFFNVGPTISTGHYGFCVPQSAGAACTAATDNYLHVTSGIWIVNGNTDVRLAVANVARVTVTAATSIWASSNTIVAGATGNKGSVALTGGSATVTVISGAVCVCNNTTTAATACKMPVSGTTGTITSGVTTDTVSYLCL